MRFRVPLLGAGEEVDPHRPDWPTYRMVEVDYTARICVIEVPDAILPVADLKPRPADLVDVNGAPVVRGLPRSSRDALDEYMARNYGVRGRRFNLEVG